MKRTRKAGAAVALLVFAFAFWVLFTPVHLSEDSALTVARELFDEELTRVGASSDGFQLDTVSGSGANWIITWRSKHNRQAKVGVSLSFVDADIWTTPHDPDCYVERSRTEETFGPICR